MDVHAGDVKHTVPASGFSPQDFPVIPACGLPSDERFATVTAGELAAAVDRVTPYMSADDTRPHLAGACLQRKDGVLRLVATDGHRLATATVAEMSHVRDDDGDRVIPRDAVEALGALLRACDPQDPVFVRVNASGTDARRVWVRTVVGTLTVVCTDASFPAWESVVPGTYEGGTDVSVDRAALLAALTAIGGGRSRGKKDAPGVRLLTADDALELRMEGGADAPSAFVSVPAVWTGAGALCKGGVGVNGRYLDDLLSTAEDMLVTLRTGTELDPVAMETQRGVAVVMPMRL
jgi:DNA polymerase-3 subunit beta